MTRRSVAIPPSTKIDPSKCRGPKGDTVRTLLNDLKTSRLSSSSSKGAGLSRQVLENMAGVDIVGENGAHPPTTGRTERIIDWVNDAVGHAPGEEGEIGGGGDESSHEQRNKQRSSFDTAMQSDDTEQTPIDSGELKKLINLMPRRAGTSEFGGEKDNVTVADTEEESDEEEEGSGTFAESRSRAGGSYRSRDTETDATNTGTTDSSFTVTANTHSTNTTGTTFDPRASHGAYKRQAPPTYQTQYRGGTTFGGAPSSGGGDSLRMSFGSSYAGRNFGSLLDRFFKKDVLVIFNIIVRRFSQMVPHVRWFFKQLVAFFSGLAHLRRAIAAFLSFLKKDPRTRQLVERIAMASGTTLRILVTIITAIYEGIIFSHWMIKDRAIPFFQENIPKSYNAVMRVLYGWAEDTPWVAMMGPFSVSFAIHESRLPRRTMATRPHLWKNYHRPEPSYFTRAMRSMSRAASSTTGYGTGTVYGSRRTSISSTETSSGENGSGSGSPTERSDTTASELYSEKRSYFEGSGNDRSVAESSSCTPPGSDNGSDGGAPPNEAEAKHTIGRIPIARQIFGL